MPSRVTSPRVTAAGMSASRVTAAGMSSTRVATARMPATRMSTPVAVRACTGVPTASCGGAVGLGAAGRLGGWDPWILHVPNCRSGHGHDERDLRRWSAPSRSADQNQSGVTDSLSAS